MRKRKEIVFMKKVQLLSAVLCVSALVLGACTTTPKKKKKKSSSEVPTSVISGTSATSQVGPSSGTSTYIPTSATTQVGPTSSSVTPVPPTSSTSVGPVVVNVTGVTVAPTSISLTVGESKTLVATVAPENATNKSVVWSILSGSDVVSVAQDGKVSALAAGSAVVQVTTVDQNKTAECSVTVTNPGPVEGWSEADLAIFAEKIYGVEVPYMKVEGAVVEADPDDAHFVTYSGGTCSPAILQEYAAKFNATDWKVEQLTDDDENLIQQWYGETEVFVGGKTRYVAAFLFAMGSSGQSTDGNGTFYLSLYDPYMYDWSEIAEYVDAVASYYADAEVSVPGVPDEYIDMLIADDTYVEQGYFELQILASSDPTEAYAEILMAAGYEWEGTDSYGYDVWTLEDYTFDVSYLYYEEYGIFDLYIEYREPVITEWPGEELLALLGGELPEIPPLEGGESYSLADYSFIGYGIVLGVYGDIATQETLDNYVASLDSAVWYSEPITGGYYVEAIEGRVYFMVGYFEADDQYDASIEFQIYLGAIDVDEFPIQEMSDFYASYGLNDIPVPEFTPTGEVTYGVVPEEGSFEVQVNGAVVADFNNYVASMQQAGWVGTQDSYGDWTFAYGDTGAYMYVGDYTADEYGNYLDIACYVDIPATGWTEEQIASFQEHLHGIVPPFVAEFSNLEWDSDDELFIQSALGDCSESVISALEEAGWTSLGEQDGFVYYGYESSDEAGYAEALIYVGEDATYGTFTNFAVYYVDYGPVIEEWTDEQIASFEEHLHGVVPPYIAEFSGLEWDAENEEFNDYLYPADCSESVISTLLGAGWSYEGDDEDGAKYYSYPSEDGAGYAMAYVYVFEYSAEYPEVTMFGMYFYEEQPSGDYGTEDEPLTCAQALVTMANDVKADGEFTAQAMYVEGTIVSIGSYNSQYKDYTNVIIRGEDGSTVTIYRLYTEVSELAKGDWIEVCGYGTMYNGNYQMNGDGSAHANVTLVDYEKGVPPVVEGYKVDFSKTTNESVSAYDKAWTATCSDGNKVTVRNGNNYNNEWTYVKFGGKEDKNLIGSIETTWKIASCASVIVEVSNKLSQNTTIYVFASDTPFEEIPTSFDGALGSAVVSNAGDIEITLSQAVTDQYIQVVFVSETGGSKNGKITVQSVTFCPAE